MERVTHTDLARLPSRIREVAHWMGSGQLRAAIAVRRAGIKACWIGIRGGEHYFKTPSGQFFSVDLVVERATLHVGIPPKVTP